jgi:hypothetical protein
MPTVTFTPTATASDRFGPSVAFQGTSKIIQSRNLWLSRGFPGTSVFLSLHLGTSEQIKDSANLLASFAFSFSVGVRLSTVFPDSTGIGSGWLGDSYGIGASAVDGDSARFIQSNAVASVLLLPSFAFGTSTTFDGSIKFCQSIADVASTTHDQSIAVASLLLVTSAGFNNTQVCRDSFQFNQTSLIDASRIICISQSIVPSHWAVQSSIIERTGVFSQSFSLTPSIKCEVSLIVTETRQLDQTGIITARTDVFHSKPIAGTGHLIRSVDFKGTGLFSDSLLLIKSRDLKHSSDEAGKTRLMSVSETFRESVALELSFTVDPTIFVTSDQFHSNAGVHESLKLQTSDPWQPSPKRYLSDQFGPSPTRYLFEQFTQSPTRYFFNQFTPSPNRYLSDQFGPSHGFQHSFSVTFSTSFDSASLYLSTFFAVSSLSAHSAVLHLTAALSVSSHFWFSVSIIESSVLLGSSGISNSTPIKPSMQPKASILISPSSEFHTSSQLPRWLSATGLSSQQSSVNENENDETAPKTSPSSPTADRTMSVPPATTTTESSMATEIISPSTVSIDEGKTTSSQSSMNIVRCFLTHLRLQPDGKNIGRRRFRSQTCLQTRPLRTRMLEHQRGILALKRRLIRFVSLSDSFPDWCCSC